MDLIKVTSIEQLDELLEQGNTDFTIASGVIRSSKYITKDGNHYFVMHYIDSSEERLTADELMADNIGRAIRNGTFYCLPMSLKTLIRYKWCRYRKDNGMRDPKFAYCHIKFLEDGSEQDVTIGLALGMDLSDDEDFHVFFYCDGLDGLLALCDEGSEDFIVTGIDGYDNSIF